MILVEDEEVLEAEEDLVESHEMLVVQIHALLEKRAAAGSDSLSSGACFHTRATMPFPVTTPSSSPSSSSSIHGGLYL